ncbi:hypothetical protein ACGFIR_31345 [Micromonospora sp. NPDC049051]|uniref:hypothetical protein n=1 Tax=Micromonospora sp. NPDC049051 TaxID=3364264 RepID=UPI003717FD37
MAGWYLPPRMLDRSWSMLYARGTLHMSTTMNTVRVISGMAQPTLAMTADDVWSAVSLPSASVQPPSFPMLSGSVNHIYDVVA